MRLFIGLPIDIKTKNILLNVQKELQNKGLSGNFTLKNNLHMTLFFLGEVQENRINDLIELVNRYNDTYDLELEKIEKLKDMLIYKVSKSERIINLYKSLKEDLNNLEYSFDDKEKFYPHITIARQIKFRSINDIVFEHKIISKENKLVLFESTRINNVLTYIKKN